MGAFSIASLKPGCRFTDAVTIEHNFLVCATGLPFNTELIAALQEWNFPEVLCDGHLRGGANPDGEAEEQPEAPQNDTPVTVIKGGRLKRALEQAHILKDPNVAEDTIIAVVETVYDHYLEYIDAVYTRYATHKELQVRDISDTVQSLCGFIALSKRYILRVQPKAPPENKNYLVNHSMRSTVLAIVMGMQLSLSQAKLVELGVSCILHEIGMIRLPPQLYLTNRKLTMSERKQLVTHPLIGYNILKDYAFPLSITLGVLDHHEKEDGSGYPRRVHGSKISTLAKIISVACSYEAITSPRTYKTEETTHTAMMDLVKNTGKQYDEAIVRALLFSISLYPIGAYVYLSDGRVALVTDVNPDSPKNPIVRLLREKNPDGTLKTRATDDVTHKISRMLTLEETASVKKSLSIK
jgi:HD-GYP domain-containing protein (c-di-GMP phosphodiesterase class II)